MQAQRIDTLSLDGPEVQSVLVADERERPDIWVPVGDHRDVGKASLVE
jgi:hypothetical protein